MTSFAEGCCYFYVVLETIAQRQQEDLRLLGDWSEKWQVQNFTR